MRNFTRPEMLSKLLQTSVALQMINLVCVCDGHSHSFHLQSTTLKQLTAHIWFDLDILTLNLTLFG